jgi:hypothetical protein
MGIDGISPATVVFPLLNFAFGTIRTAFELTSALEETASLIKSIEQVSVELKSAYRLRDTISRKGDTCDLSRIDAAIQETEDAIHDVRGMTERARVDMSTRYGKIGTRSRVLWVVRDSRKVPTELMRLALANACLKNSVDEFRYQIPTLSKMDYDSGDAGCWKNAGDDYHGIAPPPYKQATKEAMFERRRFKDQRNSLHRTASVVSSSGPPSPKLPTREDSHNSALPTTSALSHLNDVRAYVQDYEEMLQLLRPGSLAPQFDQVLKTTSEIDTNVGPDLRPCYELEATPTAMKTPIQSNVRPAQQASRAVPYTQTDTFADSTGPFLSSFVPNTRTIEQQTSISPAATLVKSSFNPRSMPQSSSTGSISQLHLDARHLAGIRLEPNLADRRQIIPPGGPPSAWRSKGTLGMKKSLGLSASSMEFEARIPGQKKPMQVRWQEPDGDDEEDHPSNSTTDAIGSANFSPQVSSDHSPGHIPGGREILDLPSSHVANIVETEGTLAPKPSRRRPARFASDAITASEPATSDPSPVTGTAPPVTPRRNLTGTRKSRTQWLVEQSTSTGTQL